MKLAVLLGGSASRPPPPAAAAAPRRSPRRPYSRRRSKDQIEEDTVPLRHWLLLHSGHPFPTRVEKKRLARECGLQLKQVEDWFLNTRRRILKHHQIAHSGRQKKEWTALIRACCRQLQLRPCTPPCTICHDFELSDSDENNNVADKEEVKADSTEFKHRYLTRRAESMDAAAALLQLSKN